MIEIFETFAKHTQKHQDPADAAVNGIKISKIRRNVNSISKKHHKITKD